MTKPSNIESIKKATGRSWEEWLAFLKDDAESSHADIAQKIAKNLEGVVDSPGWWAQNVTVAYEQHIGRRVPGQVADGTFEIATSRTLPIAKEDAQARIVELFDSRTMPGEVDVESTRTSGTDKRLYWKANLADGARVICGIEDKPGGKSLVVMTHVKISSGEAAERWRSYWKRELGEL